MPNKWVRIAGIILLLLGLVAVRFFEDQLFYDPLIKYFHLVKASFPSVDETKLYVHVFFRFILNLLLTVLLIKLLFWKQAYVKFTIIVGVIVFILTLPLYAYQLQHEFNFGQMIFFYTRRFLIQPMLLIILVPCFYYQEILNKKATK